MNDKFDTVIVGGGQAGLAMSSHLRDRGRDHIVLERHRVAERWRTERWDSLYFQFPNWSVQLPGMSYSGNNPEGFSHYSSIIRFIEGYAAKIDAPVRENTEVTALRSDSKVGGYTVLTTNGSIFARRVVIATGPFQRPMIPDCTKDFPALIYQVDASRYRGPHELPDGAVLVVGSGASGCQIADELNHSGRKVYLAVSRHRRVPRRYRGKDMMWWFQKMGRFDVAIDTFPNRKYPPSTVVTGVNGGYDVDVRKLALDGVIVLGHVRGMSEGTLALESDANQVLNDADKAYADFISSAETLADSLDLPPVHDKSDSKPPSQQTSKIPDIQSLNLDDAEIRSVVWATGYRFDFDWIKLPVLDLNSSPVQQRGVTNCSGIYFLGLHWMHTFKSGLFSFVGEDAHYLANHMETLDDRSKRI